LKRYNAVCCSCNYHFKAAASISQELGLTTEGCGSCPSCGVTLQLTLNKKAGVMNTKRKEIEVHEHI
jgi:hypothetical protein